MKQQRLSLIESQRRFSSEEACVQHLFGLRWPEGYHCPKCGHIQYCFHTTRRLYQCGKCKYQVSVTAGTIFHKTRTPLVKWFWMIFMMTRQKSGASMMSLQRMLGISSYKTAWTMGKSAKPWPTEMRNINWQDLWRWMRLSSVRANRVHRGGEHEERQTSLSLPRVREIIRGLPL